MLWAKSTKHLSTHQDSKLMALIRHWQHSSQRVRRAELVMAMRKWTTHAAKDREGSLIAAHDEKKKAMASKAIGVVIKGRHAQTLARGWRSWVTFTHGERSTGTSGRGTQARTHLGTWARACRN